MKRRTTLYLDGDKIDNLVNDGWNVSRLCEMAIDSVIGEEFDDFSKVTKVNKLMELVDQLNDELVSLRLRTQQVEYELSVYNVMIEEAKSTMETIKITSALNKYIQDLNRCIIACNYDLNVVLGREASLIENIVRLNPGFSVEHQIERMRKIMDV